MFLLKPYFFIVIFIKCLPAFNYEKFCGAQFCNKTRKHTLCKFQSEDPARHCLDWEQTIKSWKDKQAILDKLNGRRNKVAAGEIRSLPAADNINKLEWNQELELSAQRWANQCVKHSVPDIKDACRDLEMGRVGQSIATIAGEAPGLTPAAMVDVWYMELLNLNASVLPAYEPSVATGFLPYDYFTQLVWAETTQVGCGGVKFKERIPGMDLEKNRTIYRLVCNFYPGGNVENYPVYTLGKPCSKCQAGGNCDSVYKALCAPKSTTTKTTTKRKFNVSRSALKNKSSNIETTKTINTETTTEGNDNFNETEDFTPYDYFPHLHEFIRPTLTTATTTPVPCKDISAVEDFIALLKNKLSSDPLLKELLPSTKFAAEQFADASVAAFVSSLYGKKTTPWSSTVTSEFVNSTLLVDLVEAVIFRSGEKARTYIERTTQPMSDDVSAIKIQAELGEIKQNADFTGHYFFPEDVSNEGDTESSRESTDTFYDATSPKVSDVVKEIEDIKRSKYTKDFLEEILESDYHTEIKARYTPMLIKEEANANSDDSININDEITRIKRKHNGNDDKIGKLVEARYNPIQIKKEANIKSEDTININEKLTRIKRDHNHDNDDKFPKQYNNMLKSLESNYAKLDYRSCHITYREMLKQLASDLGVLNLNARFHCVTTSAGAMNQDFLVFYCILIYYINFNVRLF